MALYVRAVHTHLHCHTDTSTDTGRERHTVVDKMHASLSLIESRAVVTPPPQARSFGGRDCVTHFLGTMLAHTTDDTVMLPPSAHAHRPSPLASGLPRDEIVVSWKTCSCLPAATNHLDCLTRDTACTFVRVRAGIRICVGRRACIQELANTLH